jgi:MOSC domain-containing protein YiiM
MTGSVLHLFIKPAHGQPMREVERVMTIAGQGLEGDAAFGRSRRQVLVVDQAMLEEFGLHPGQTRENIVLAGIGLTGLPVGTRLRIGQAVLEVTGDCAPCGFMDTVRPGLRDDIRGRRGLMARVHVGGLIQVGDPAGPEPMDPA